MKKIIVVLSVLFVLVGCSGKKENSIEMKNIKDFYSEEYLSTYYDHKDELPVKMSYQESSMMYEDITDKELIEKVYNALFGIEIGEKTNLDITDAERNYWFTYADGTSIYFMMINADKDMMIYNPVEKCNYEIVDDNGLFKISIGE